VKKKKKYMIFWKMMPVAMTYQYAYCL